MKTYDTYVLVIQAIAWLLAVATAGGIVLIAAAMIKEYRRRSKAAPRA